MGQIGKMSADAGGIELDLDTRQRLVESVKNGNEDSVVEILDRIGWDVGLGCVSFQYGTSALQDTGTLLHVASSCSNSRLVKLFLENNAHPGRARGHQRHSTPLHLSAQCGDLESSKLLISVYDCSVDTVDEQGRTALHWASLYGWIHVVKLLIDHNADVHRGDDLGWRPVHHASLNGHASTLEFLVECAGAAINCTDNSGETPLHFACRHGEMLTASLLLSLGADSTICDFDQHTAPYYAVANGHLHMASIFTTSLPNILVTARDNVLQEFLHLALNIQSLQLLSYVCECGALENINSKIITQVVKVVIGGDASEDLPSSASGAVQGSVRAMRKGQVARIMLAASEALQSASAEVISDVLTLAMRGSSVEVALAVFRSKVNCVCVLNRKLLSNIFVMAVKEESVELALAVCSIGVPLFDLVSAQILTRALELALDTSSSELLAILVTAGVLQQSNAKMKERVLCKAAVKGDLNLADHCIFSGVLHGFSSWSQPTAIEIAAERGHSRLVEKLRKALDNHQLLIHGQRDASTVLIRVVGPPGAGKSTLVKSLTTSRLWGFFRNENQLDEGDKNFSTRTRGIKVKSHVNKSGLLYRILDLGGQDDFTAANQLFMGEGQVPIINIMTVSLLKDYPELETEVLKWSAFFASRCEDRSSRLKSQLQPVILVATRNESARAADRENAEKAMIQAISSYGTFLDFQAEPVFVDARKSWNGDMEALRVLLANVAEKLVKQAPPQSSLCNDIQRCLPWIHSKVKCPIISRKDLPDLVAQGLSSWRRTFDKNVILSNAELMDAAVRQLSDACEILSFEIPELKDTIVIDPPWLLHDVVSVLLSPAKFPPPRVLYDRNGRAERKQAGRALEAKFSHLVAQDHALEMVAQLGICILDKQRDGRGGDQDIVVPSKLETSRNLEAILSAMDSVTIWFGIEVLCSTVPLSVCLFPQLQAHLHNFLLKQCKQKPILWKGGIAVALPHEQVVGIVEARRGRMAIDIIVQGTEATRRTCFCMLQMLKEQTLLKAQQFSSGSDITETILSSRELSSLDWSKSNSMPRITYDREDVQKAVERHGKIRPQHDDERLCVLEDAFPLMAVPHSHVCLMSAEGFERFCHEMNHPQWTAEYQKLALCLSMPEYLLSRLNRKAADMANPTGAILEWWSQCSTQHTIERLLAAVKIVGNLEAAAILEKELTYSLNVLPAVDSEPIVGADWVSAELPCITEENTPSKTSSSLIEDQRSFIPGKEHLKQLEYLPSSPVTVQENRSFDAFEPSSLPGSVRKPRLSSDLVNMPCSPLASATTLNVLACPVSQCRTALVPVSIHDSSPTLVSGSLSPDSVQESRFDSCRSAGVHKRCSSLDHMEEQKLATCCRSPRA